MYAVEFIFNKDANDYIESLWEYIYLNNINTNYHKMNGIKPHISLAVYNDLDIEAFLNKFIKLKKNFSPISIDFDILGTFPSTGTCFIKPTVTMDLLLFHNEYIKNFSEFSDFTSEFYKIGSWNPHCSLGFKLESNSVKDIFTLIFNNFKPFKAELIDIILVKINFNTDGSSTTEIIA